VRPRRPPGRAEKVTNVLTEQLRTGRFDGRRFTARRLLKLWPVLHVFLAVEKARQEAFTLWGEPVGSRDGVPLQTPRRTADERSITLRGATGVHHPDRAKDG
jgi:hypothetical protein